MTINYYRIKTNHGLGIYVCPVYTSTKRSRFEMEMKRKHGDCVVKYYVFFSVKQITVACFSNMILTTK